MTNRLTEKAMCDICQMVFDPRGLRLHLAKCEKKRNLICFDAADKVEQNFQSLIGNNDNFIVQLYCIFTSFLKEVAVFTYRLAAQNSIAFVIALILVLFTLQSGYFALSNWIAMLNQIITVLGSVLSALTQKFLHYDANSDFKLPVLSINTTQIADIVAFRDNKTLISMNDFESKRLTFLKEFEDLTSKYAHQQQQLEKQHKNLENQKHELTEERDEFIKRIKNDFQDQDSLNQLVQRQIQELKNSDTQSNSEFQTIQRQVQELKNSKQHSANDFTTIKHNIQELNESNRDFTRQVQELKNSEQHSANDFTTIKHNIQELNESNRDFTRQVQELKHFQQQSANDPTTTQRHVQELKDTQRQIQELKKSQNQSTKDFTIIQHQVQKLEDGQEDGQKKSVDEFLEVWRRFEVMQATNNSIEKQSSNLKQELKTFKIDVENSNVKYNCIVKNIEAKIRNLGQAGFTTNKDQSKELYSKLKDFTSVGQFCNSDDDTDAD